MVGRLLHSSWKEVTAHMRWDEDQCQTLDTVKEDPVGFVRVGRQLGINRERQGGFGWMLAYILTFCASFFCGMWSENIVPIWKRN